MGRSIFSKKILGYISIEFLFLNRMVVFLTLLRLLVVSYDDLKIWNLCSTYSLRKFFFVLCLDFSPWANFYNKLLSYYNYERINDQITYYHLIYFIKIAAVSITLRYTTYVQAYFNLPLILQNTPLAPKRNYRESFRKNLQFQKKYENW